MLASGMTLPVTTSADWSDQDIAAIGAIFHTLGTTPESVFPVMMFESGARPDRQNPRKGHATGLLQWMDFNLAGYGYTPDEFKRLSIAEQLPYVYKYFAPHTGQLINSTAVYMLLWQPAYVAHAGDPNWTHPSWSQSYNGGSPFNIYNQNSAFDKAGRGYIVVGDLRDVADGQLYRPRTQELIARTRRAMGLETSVAKGVGIAGVGLVVGLGTLAWYLAKRWV